mgnify:CR=1 FL=1
MFKSSPHTLLALTLALSATAGCAKQANLSQAPVGQAQKAAATSGLATTEREAFESPNS